MADFWNGLRENWMIVLFAVLYLAQLIKVIHSQYTRLKYGNHMPLWKLSLFILPGVPLLWGFFKLFLFDALFKVFVMTYHADRKRKNAPPEVEPVATAKPAGSLEPDLVIDDLQQPPYRPDPIYRRSHF